MEISIIQKVYLHFRFPYIILSIRLQRTLLVDTILIASPGILDFLNYLH